jgi:SAM-dependent methyltransferase
MRVWGVDISPVAIDLARDLAEEAGVSDHCRFDVFDLDEGFPPGPSVDVILCYLFRDPRLYQPMMERLSPGGILALALLSEVGVGPGQFRARRGELKDAFGSLDVLVDGEGNGIAWILGRRPAVHP